MKSDKEIKKNFKIEACESPDDFYPTNFLKNEGFVRKKCSCGTFFWTVNRKQENCGDPSCIGEIDILKTPAKNYLTYIDVWKKIIEVLEPRGYKPIKRYPVVARWNPTTEYTIASIAAFQPYVISGEIDPPEKKLLIPQLCLRFGDIDNVGVTGSHMTCFVMIGQHMFVNKDEWNQEEVFKDIYDFVIYGVGLDKTELTIHEDAWAGGGNFGPCMEFFSRGIELFNQVYMMFEQTESGRKDLKLKVLDMGLGMERIAWFSQGKENIYEATFPKTLDKIKNKININLDFDLYSKFSKYSALLNADEVENMDKAWERVSNLLNINGVDSKKLKEIIEPMVALYSIAEHSRTLLVAITDGALLSNVGGGYNLRILFRRAMRFIDKYNWDLDLKDVVEWHSEELKDIFPELNNNISNIKTILDIEKERYFEMKDRSKKIIEKVIQKEINTNILIELYDSQGINPDIIKEEVQKLGKKIIVPENFYTLVSERHEIQENKNATVKDMEIDIGTVPDTKALYFDDWKGKEFTAKVLKIIDNKYVILDRTHFYPTSGGQLNDEGDLNGDDVINVFKQGKVIIHELSRISFNEGDIIRGNIDLSRRKQLADHHTATHIVNAAAKKILGDHINQAGAKKTLEKATLDLTHYKNIEDEELKDIELEANNIVKRSINIEKKFMKREEAEREYGMRIYQGGAVPGRELRIVNIGGVDIEACGGTHLNNTNETGHISLLKSTKIQDGIVRITFTSGSRSNELSNIDNELIEEISKLLNVEKPIIPSRAEEIFNLWKKTKKALKKGKETPPFKLVSEKKFKGDILEETAKRLKTQKEHIVSTLNRFINDLK